MTADELPTSASCVYVMSMFIKTNFAQCLAFLQHSARSQCTCMHFSPNLQLRTATNIACSVRVYCLSVRQSSDPAKTAEPTEMPFPAESILWAITCGCTLASAGEYDGMICAVVAMRAVAAITVACFRYNFVALTISTNTFSDRPLSAIDGHQRPIHTTREPTQQNCSVGGVNNGQY